MLYKNISHFQTCHFGESQYSATQSIKQKVEQWVQKAQPSISGQVRLQNRADLAAIFDDNKLRT